MKIVYDNRVVETGPLTERMKGILLPFTKGKR
jgi:hypothetical protein